MRRVSPYFDVKHDAHGRDYLEVHLSGIALLRLPMTNKGTAFTLEERIELGLDGLLPPQVNTLEQQLERVYWGFRSAPTPIAKYQYLRQLQERQEILFYALLEKYLGEMLPIVYTPTVGEAVQRFSSLYQTPRGLSLSPLNVDRAKRIVANYPLEDVRMIVATDSSAILGIGDQGYGGLAIPIGKLALYTVAGGVSPFHTMPVALDVGTDRIDLINDPFYLGVRQRRLRGEAYAEFVEQFVEAVRSKWPRAVVQWEDLSKEAAFTVLERFRKVLPSFNDDIQGTGAVALAGVLSACEIKREKLRDQVIVIHGAGAGGVGVALALRRGLVDHGLSVDEAHARIFVIDSKGLLMEGRPMEDYKRPFCRTAAHAEGWKLADGGPPSLQDVVENARATVLLGLSGQARAFTEPVVRAMAANTERPVVFPLSNPTSATEALPEEVVAWTEGRAIVATGSPFAPVGWRGSQREIGQGNNAFIFPGLGFGAVLADASEITDAMVLAAAYALAGYTAEKHVPHGRVYPPVEELQEVSLRVAVSVVEQALRDGVARSQQLDRDDVEGYVRAKFWRPRYMPVVRGT